MVEKYNKDGSISLDWFNVEVTKIKENKGERQIPEERFGENKIYLTSVLSALDKLKKDDLNAFNNQIRDLQAGRGFDEGDIDRSFLIDYIQAFD